MPKPPGAGGGQTRDRKAALGCSGPSPPPPGLHGPLSPGQSMCLFVALLGFDACEQGRQYVALFPFSNI